jgi:hypothetical protein
MPATPKRNRAKGGPSRLSSGAIFSETKDLANQPIMAAPARYSQAITLINQLCLGAAGALSLAVEVRDLGFAGLRDAMSSNLTATPVNTGQARPKRLTIEQLPLEL